MPFNIREQGRKVVDCIKTKASETIKTIAKTIGLHYIDVCSHNGRDSDPVPYPQCKDDSVKIRSVTYPKPKLAEELPAELANGMVTANCTTSERRSDTVGEQLNSTY